MKQESFNVRSHGGVRVNAGRKKGPRSGLPHTKRDKITRHTPAHVTIKFLGDLPNLRTPSFLEVFGRAVEMASGRGLRVTHFAILSNHIHAIVEADSNEALSSGMTSLKTAIAWFFRRKFEGALYDGRYHLHVLKSPREVRNAVQYVEFNESKHRKAKPFVDRYSSADPRNQEMVAEARCWLLRTNAD